MTAQRSIVTPSIKFDACQQKKQEKIFRPQYFEVFAIFVFAAEHSVKYNTLLHFQGHPVLPGVGYFLIWNVNSLDWRLAVRRQISKDPSARNGISTWSFPQSNPNKNNWNYFFVREWLNRIGNSTWVWILSASTCHVKLTLEYEKKSTF